MAFSLTQLRQPVSQAFAERGAHRQQPQRRQAGLEPTNLRRA